MLHDSAAKSKIYIRFILGNVEVDHLSNGSDHLDLAGWFIFRPPATLTTSIKSTYCRWLKSGGPSETNYPRPGLTTPKSNRWANLIFVERKIVTENLEEVLERFQIPRGFPRPMEPFKNLMEFCQMLSQRFSINNFQMFLMLWRFFYCIQG